MICNPLIVIIRIRDKDKCSEELDKFLQDPKSNPAINDNEALYLAALTNQNAAWRLLKDQRVREVLINSGKKKSHTLRNLLRNLSTMRRYRLANDICKAAYPNENEFRITQDRSISPYIRNRLTSYRAATKWQNSIRERALYNSIAECVGPDIPKQICKFVFS